MKTRAGDRLFLVLTALLVIAGIFVFISAALSVYAEDASRFGKMLLNHGLLGLGGGLLSFYIISRARLKTFQTQALFWFLLALVVTGLVFVPGVGIAHGGATRWISVGPFSFQPSEFLKIASIVVYASWLAHARDRIREIKFGILPLLIAIIAVGGVLLPQPDTDGFLIIAGTLVALYFLAGGPWKHIGVIVGISILGAGILIWQKPYIFDRVKTFMNPSHDPLGSSYQVQQSMIALGSGGISGRGFGQSIQKFRYLPEPVNDSIFAVLGEEFGFIGTTLLIVLYVAFFMRGLWIARRSDTPFGNLLASGIVILIFSQSLLNMASVAGIFPLAGLPLVFVSQGGTAMLTALIGAGLVYAVSKSSRPRREN